MNKTTATNLKNKLNNHYAGRNFQIHFNGKRFQVVEIIGNEKYSVAKTFLTLEMNGIIG